jgi:diamine N-acetyltransferase
MIEGDLVALGPIRRDLIGVYQRWFNDLGTLRTIGMPPVPLTFESEEAWFEGRSAVSDLILFTIYERATSRPVGNTSLSGISYRNRSAEFGITIGEPDARGKGYGTETAHLMLDYAFTALGLHSVMLRVTEYNRAGRRAYEKAGFREIGRRRQSHMMGGKLWDSVYMDCIASEFTSPVLSRLLKPDEPQS